MALGDSPVLNVCALPCRGGGWLGVSFLYRAPLGEFKYRRRVLV